MRLLPDPLRAQTRQSDVIDFRWSDSPTASTQPFAPHHNHVDIHTHGKSIVVVSAPHARQMAVVAVVGPVEIGGH